MVVSVVGSCLCCSGWTHSHAALSVSLSFLIALLLKLKFRQYPAIHSAQQLHYIPLPPLYNIIIIFETVLRQKKNLKHKRL